MQGAPDGAELVIRRLPGRLRHLRHALMLLPVAATAWAWFGVAGAVPAVIWWWHRRPVRRSGIWRLDLAQARSARLGPWCTRVLLRGQPAVEIFNDEADPAELARLRRALKARLGGYGAAGEGQLAAG